MLDIYELPKRIACSYAFSDSYSFIVGALGMTSCEQNAWEDDIKHIMGSTVKNDRNEEMKWA